MVNVAILSATAWEMMHKMAEVKWIKLSVALPDNKKIKQIRKLPDGDTIALMWVFLLCLAGDVNDDGAVYFTPEIPYTDEMLAGQFDMDINTVRLALKTFQHFGMIEIIDDIIHLDSWEKWQSTESLSKIREQNRLRKQKQREREKLLPAAEESHVTCHVTERDSHATEEDKEEEQDKRRDKETIYTSVISYLNEKAGTKYRATTSKTQALIRAREREGFTLDDFKAVIDKKCAEWMGCDMEKYLRPETLFGPKFEGYLNEKGRGKNGISSGSAPSDSEEVAKRVGTWL